MIMDVFIAEKKELRSSLTDMFLHEPKWVLDVLKSRFYRLKFTDGQMQRYNNYLGLEKWLNNSKMESLKEIALEEYKKQYGDMGILCFHFRKFCLLFMRYRKKYPSTETQIFSTSLLSASNYCGIALGNVSRTIMAAAQMVWQIWNMFVAGNDRRIVALQSLVVLLKPNTAKENSVSCWIAQQH